MCCHYLRQGVPSQAFDADLLATAEHLTSGRACAGGLCSNQCALLIFNQAASLSETQELIDHFERVWNAEHSGKQEEMVDKQKWVMNSDRSAKHGTVRGHLLYLRIIERIKRLTALLFHVPPSQLSEATYFVDRRDHDRNNQGPIND